MSFWDKIKDKLSPKKQIAGIVDAVVDRLSERYDLKLKGRIEGSEIIVDPQITRKGEAVDLDAVAK